MRTLETKADRLKYQQAQIDSRLAEGGSLETYKGLKIVTNSQPMGERTRHTLLVFRDDAGRPIENVYSYSLETLQRSIERLKKSYDNREAWKAEQKAKGKHQSNQAQAAAAIREELKAKFPGVKFSVTSEGFSMGDAVRVNWTDGPTDDEVTNITAKYEYGHFNGMEDIYEYSNRRDDIPQTKYLTTSRKKSEETKTALEAGALNIWPGDEWQAEQTRDRRTYEIWSKTSLPVGAIVKGFKWEGNDVVIDFEAPAATATEAPNFERVEVEPGSVQVIDYSDKAFAVIGDTKPVKDKLKELGGSFNPRLTCGAGWIFSKKRLEAVTAALGAPMQPDPEQVDTTTQEEERAIMEVSKPENNTDKALQLAQEAGERAAAHNPAGAAEAMEAAAKRLLDMAAQHRAKMAVIGQGIAKEQQLYLAM